MFSHRSPREFSVALAAILLATGLSSAQPANDNCGAAIVISPGTTVAGTTAAATSDLPGSGCSINDNIDVWYAFTAPSTGEYFIHTNASVGLNATTLSIFDGCGGSLLYCDDDAGLGERASMIVQLNAAQNVRIRVSGENNATGAFQLHVSRAIIPGGSDVCSAATAVSATNTYFGDSSFATSDIPFTSCALGAANDLIDVWFRFTPTSTAEYRLDTDGSPGMNDTTISVWSACGGTQLYCDDDAGAGNLSAVTALLNAGLTYRIRVAGWNGQIGQFLLNVGPPIPPASAPANDPCGAAQLLASLPASVPGTNAGATSDLAAASCNAPANDAFDVWYRFTAVATPDGTTRIETAPVPGGLADSTLAIFDACGGNELYCDDDLGIGALSRIVAPLTPGVTYWARVAGYNGTRGAFMFNVGATPPPPANDICATAAVVGATLTETVDNYYALHELDEPAGSCNSGAALGLQNSIWYTFNSSTGGQLTGTVVDVYDVYDMVAVLYTGQCGTATLNEVACWDEPQPLDLAAPSVGDSFLAPNTQYYLVIGDWGVGPEGAPTTVTINVPGGAPTTGACCIGSSCTVLSEADCTTAGGNFAGGACNSPGNNTAPCCRADFDQNGTVQVPDIFAFLSAWFAQSLTADFDRNSIVQVPDIFAFLSAWFAGCP